MKKNKQTITQRRASAKRGAKRSARLKKTQKEKHVRKAKKLAEAKSKEQKFKEAMDRMMQSKYAK